MIEDLLAAIPLGFFLAFLIGPVFFVLLETSAVKGVRAAFSLDLGVIVADVVFILIAYFSTNKLLEKIKDDPALYIFGGVLFVTYGIISLIKNKKNYKRHEENESIITIKKNNYVELFIKGFLLNFINIGVLGFWLGLIIVFGPQLEMDPNRMIFFFGAILGTYLVIDIFKMFAAKKLNKKLTPYRIYKIKRLISIIIIISGVVLLFNGIFPKQINETFEDQIERRIPTI